VAVRPFSRVIHNMLWTKALERGISASGVTRD
jgi:hypothetical protein